MTGTAAQNWWEIRRVYKIWVVPVPTNRPVIRERWPDRVFPTEDAKFDTIVEEIVRLHNLGRPILIGTRSVEKSEKLSKKLHAAGIEHQVLNAKFHEQEAKIVEHAGEPGPGVTIATNMAGRGTDIKLGKGVAAAGGLHVLGTERHEAVRIDPPAIGPRRAARATPAAASSSCRWRTNCWRGLGPDRQEDLKEEGVQGGNVDWQSYHRLFVKCAEAAGEEAPLSPARRPCWCTRSSVRRSSRTSTPTRYVD